MKKILFLSVFVLSTICMEADNTKLDINAKMPGIGLTPLNAACAYNKFNEAQLLLNMGANPNIPAHNGNPYKGNYPLHFAAMHLNTELKQLLIAKGADPQLTNEAGVTSEDIEKKMRELRELHALINAFNDL